jgi:N-acyl-L-homoserine lactone synthetase
MQLTGVAEHPIEQPETEPGHFGLLAGYRFRICEDAEQFASALALRRDVYVGDFGYDVPVPDQYDDRSWLLVAESVAEGEIVGTMRITPRALGPLEAEEYFRLPAHLAGRRVVEISRFAIRRSHRKTRALPSVSLGLFKLCYEFALAEGAEFEVICSKASNLAMYDAMGFRSTGLRARYETLNGVEHELLCHDFRRSHVTVQDPLLRALFCDMSFDEILLPVGRPPLGLVERPMSLAACA